MDNVEKSTPQTLNNPYIVFPEKKEIDQLSIPKGKSCFFNFLFMYLFLFVDSIIILSISKLPFLIPIFLLPIILALCYCCTSKIELIKDKSKEIIIVLEKNGLCCKKRYNLSLEYTDFKVIKDGFDALCCSKKMKSKILFMNVNPNMADLDNSNIKNTPFKFIYRFKNLIDKHNQLELDLENLIEYKFENKIENDINLYVPKQDNDIENLLLENPNKYSERFVKISEHFYLFYNYNYIYFSKSKSKSNESFERLDWIYSNNFDRIFIGVVKNDSFYVNTFIYDTNIIDKFILEIKDGKYCFKVLLKDGNNTEIYRYKREQEKYLNIFIYLINGQINKINNVNQVISDYSTPTLD